MTEVVAIEGSAIIGQHPLEIDFFRQQGMRVIDVLRGDASLRRDFASVTIQVSDRIVIRTAAKQ